jgi:hypothetical protein
MYAVGVLNLGAQMSPQGWGSARGGIYLYPGQATGGWGGDDGGSVTPYEFYGQQKGRWYCTLPYGVVPVQEPASIKRYGERLYITGGYSYNLVIDEHHRIWKQGIRPPEEVPDVAYTPSGGSNITTICYFSWYDEYTGERSPLSKGLELSDCPFGTSKTWQNLPKRPPDDVYIGDDQVDPYNTAEGSGVGTHRTVTGGSRIQFLRPGDKMHLLGAANQRYSQCWYYNPVLFDVHNGWNALPTSGIAVSTVSRATHLEIWLSVAGDFPRLRTRLAIGSDSYVEASEVEDLGEAFIDSFQRFPRCTMNEIYHDRQIAAGDPENPDTIFLSELFYPERFSGQTFQTRNGEPITGLLSTKDYCLVFTRNNTYMLQGYTDNDYTLTVIDQSLGSVGHNCNIVIFGNPYVWTEQGPFLFNGQWHPLSPENRWTPVSPSVEGSPAYSAGLIQPGKSMVATLDPYFNTYIVSSAYIAAREQEQPWKYRNMVTPDEEGLASEGQTEGGFSQDSFPWSDIDVVGKYYAVLDYARVQPEAGGRYSSSRLLWDTKMNSTPTAPEWMQYLRNRWGQGALYIIGTTGPLVSFSIIALKVTDYAVENWTQESFDFIDTFKKETDSRIALAFDMIGEEGGYEMEQKSFKRLWFHMRRNINNANALSMIVHSLPDSGFYNDRLSGIWLRSGTPGDDALFHKEEGKWLPFSGAGNFPIGQAEGDVIKPPLPENLAGRGLWIEITGRYFHWHGFGGEYIVGREGRLNDQQTGGGS